MNLLQKCLMPLLFIGCSNSVPTPLTETQEDELLNLRIRATIQPYVQEVPRSIEHAKAIISLLHFQNHLMSTTAILSVDRAQNVLNTLSRSDWGHICGGLGITAVDMLRAYGYPARIVQLFALDNYNTHVSVEFYVDDKWIAIDPTFNATFINEEGDYVDYSTMYHSKTIIPIYALGTKETIASYPYDYRLYFGTVRLLPIFIRSNASLDIYYQGEIILK